MACTTHWEDTGVLWVFTGEVTDEDLLSINLALYEDARFPELTYAIANYLDVTTFSATSDMIRRIAVMDRTAAQINPNLKIASIATKDLIKGLTRMYELSADTSWEVGSFEDEQSAREWIGV
jgi:hypothetical protein